MFFATAPKFVYIILITRFLFLDFFEIISVFFNPLFIVLALLTTIVGAFGLMREKADIFRFLG